MERGGGSPSPVVADSVAGGSDREPVVPEHGRRVPDPRDGIGIRGVVIRDRQPVMADHGRLIRDHGRLIPNQSAAIPDQ